MLDVWAVPSAEALTYTRMGLRLITSGTICGGGRTEEKIGNTHAAPLPFGLLVWPVGTNRHVLLHAKDKTVFCAPVNLRGMSHETQRQLTLCVERERRER